MKTMPNQSDARANCNAPGNASSLSVKRQRFVDEYLIDLNGAQAAIRAGYLPTSAKVTASRLLTDDNVAAAITARREQLSRHAEVTAERVVDELAKIAFANMSDFIDVDENGCTTVRHGALADRTLAAAIDQFDITTNAKGETRTRIKLADKKGALLDLGRHLGLFAEKALPPPTEQEAKPDPRTLAMAILAVLRDVQDSASAPLEIEFHPAT
jgi:phage terminase small subunit